MAEESRYDSRHKILDCIRNQWLAGWQIQQRLVNVYGVTISESSVLRRVRELKEDRYGGWIVEKRPASKGSEGSAGMEYRVKDASVSKNYELFAEEEINDGQGSTRSTSMR